MIKAVRSLASQADQMHVFRGDNELGDANKFRGTIGKEGYIFTVDDDLLYPSDYIAFMIRKIEQYERKAVISLTGKTLTAPRATTYFRKSEFEIYRCLDGVDRDTRCHIVGTGVLGWHTDLLRPAMEWFHKKNIADVLFSIQCNRMKIPRIVAAHPAGWLQNINEDAQTCWMTNYKRREEILELINAERWDLCD